MARRVPAEAKLRNKVMIALDDSVFTTLSHEAEVRDLSVSTVARYALLQGLPGILTKRQTKQGVGSRMTESKTITYVHVNKGARPGDVEDSKQEDVCYRLPEGGIDGLSAMGVLNKADFLVASADTPRPLEPEPEEKAHVVLLPITYQEGFGPISHGDGTVYYYLRGATCSQTMEALEEAGFERSNDKPEGAYIT